MHRPQVLLRRSNILCRFREIRTLLGKGPEFRTLRSTDFLCVKLHHVMQIHPKPPSSHTYAQIGVYFIYIRFSAEVRISVRSRELRVIIKPHNTMQMDTESLRFHL